MAIEIWVACFGTVPTVTAASGTTAAYTTNSKPLIYRFSAATGNPVGTGAVSSSATAQMVLGTPYQTNHGGTIIPRGATVGAWSPNGQQLISLSGSAVATIYNAPTQSGNVVTAGGGEILHDFQNLRPTHRAIYVSTGASAEELWVWDGQTGIVQRYLASSGARITSGGSYFFAPSDTTHGTGVQTGDYQLCGGTDIACVTTA